MTPSLYRRVLGPAFDALPPTLRQLHDLTQSTAFTGDAEVIAASHPIARLIARLTGFPTRSYQCRVDVRIDIDNEGETWHRDFGGHRFHSRLYCQNGILTEHIGPHRIQFQLHTDTTQLSMHPIAWRTLGIPLPRFLWPQVQAQETEHDGRFHFDVTSAFPLIGTVIHYRGVLRRVV
jgi:hypothetical protein